MASSQEVQIVKKSQVWAGKFCELILRERTLSLQDEGANVFYSVALEDVIGLKILDNPPKGKATVCRAEICTYFLGRSSHLKKKEVRKLRVEEIHFFDKETIEENQQTAKEWRDAIQHQCLENDRRIFISPEDSDTTPLRPQRVLVIINPFSGTKKSEPKFRKLVQPMFEIAGIEIVEILLTERTGHAAEKMRDFDLSLIDAIVTASGDGIIYEVANGLLARPDWETAIKTPVCALPTGSGNGLAASQLHEINEECSVTNAAFQLIRGGVQQVDLATIRNGSKTVYMVLIFAWGLVADVDIESEKFRVLGGQVRDTLGALKAIAQRRLYHGRLSYLPMDGEQQEGQPLQEKTAATHSNTVEQSQTTAGGNAMEPANTQMPTPEHNSETNEASTGDATGDVTKATGDITSDVTEATGDVTEATGDVTEATGDVTEATGDVTEATGDVIEAIGDVTEATGDVIEATGDVTEATGDVIEATGDVTETTNNSGTVPIYGPKTSLLPPSLSSPVPSNWHTVEGNFIQFLGLFGSFMGEGFMGHPDVRLGSGDIMLEYSLDDTKRGHMLKMLTSIEDGSHVKMDQIHSVRTKAFRLEPLTTQGIMTADGEVLEYGPCDFEVHPNIFHVCSRKRRDSNAN